jgi:hypothetical protein
MRRWSSHTSSAARGCSSSTSPRELASPARRRLANGERELRHHTTLTIRSSLSTSSQGSYCQIEMVAIKARECLVWFVRSFLAFVGGHTHQLTRQRPGTHVPSAARRGATARCRRVIDEDYLLDLSSSSCSVFLMSRQATRSHASFSTSAALHAPFPRLDPQTRCSNHAAHLCTPEYTHTHISNYL